MDLIGNGRVLHGGTYNTNLVSTAAALAVLQILRRDGRFLVSGARVTWDTSSWTACANGRQQPG